MTGLKALIATLAIGVAVQLPGLNLFAQQSVGEVDGVAEIVTWGLREGPAAVVVLVILFFYRRDFMGEAKKKQEAFEIVMQIVKDSTTANAELAGVLRENNTVTHGLKRAIEARFDLRLKEPPD